MLLTAKHETHIWNQGEIMKNRMSPMRRHSRFPVNWRVMYGTTEFVAEGTVLDLTTRGWRIAGTMPVLPGMPLRLQVCVPERPEPLHVLRATVLWVNNYEFAIEADEMARRDETWVTEFLRHKLGLMWMAQEGPPETSHQVGGEASWRRETSRQPCRPVMDDILKQFLALNMILSDIPTEARWNRDLDFQEGETDAQCDPVPAKIWHEADRILRGMLAIKSAHIEMGRDVIADN